MRVEQYVMAYGIEQDRIRAVLPEGFSSLRPVLRINGEILDQQEGYLEFNTAVEKDGKKGWLNIGYWEDIPFTREDNKVTFENEVIKISFEGVGIEGSCPAEKDNEGCFFLNKNIALRPPETILESKEFCDCQFSWKLPSGAHGVSIGKTLPAIPTKVETQYPKKEFTVENAAVISCNQVLGTYKVCFQR